MFGREAAEGEHAVLFDDEVEVLSRAFGFEKLDEFLAHGFDAAAHFVEFGNPLCFQIRVFQHEGDGVRGVGGRRRA